MPYKHAEAIKAWLDGKTIQKKIEENHWVDIYTNPIPEVIPAFSVKNEYRIKPEPILVKYRRYYYGPSDAPGVFACSEQNRIATPAVIEGWKDFKGWIDKDWVTAEYEPKD